MLHCTKDHDNTLSYHSLTFPTQKVIHRFDIGSTYEDSNSKEGNTVNMLFIFSFPLIEYVQDSMYGVWYVCYVLAWLLLIVNLIRQIKLLLCVIMGARIASLIPSMKNKNGMLLDGYPEQKAQLSLQLMKKQIYASLHLYINIHYV